MSERESRVRTILITFFPMFIATLSLVASIYNGYLNALFVDLMQRNVSRTEYLRTCKDVIEAYYQVKFRAGVISRNRAAGAASGLPADQVEGANALAKINALGTYLANLRGEAVRQRYTEMNVFLGKAMEAAAATPPDGLVALFAPADRIFAELNGDCVKAALDRPV